MTIKTLISKLKKVVANTDEVDEGSYRRAYPEGPQDQSYAWQTLPGTGRSSTGDQFVTPETLLVYLEYQLANGLRPSATVEYASKPLARTIEKMCKEADKGFPCRIDMCRETSPDCDGEYVLICD